MSPENFWRRVQRLGPDECWPYLSYKEPRGYGNLVFRGHHTRAHRVAYLLAVGPIPDGMAICHACDNPPCCNPAHLWVGTRAENNADCQAKGRGVAPPLPQGSKSHLAKLDERRVLEIRRKSRAGVSNTDLAAEYGVSRNCIWAINSGLNWRHVEMPA